MTWLEYAAWGAFGGAAVEGLQVYSAIRNGGKWASPSPWPFAISVVIRLFIGAGLAAAFGQSGQFIGPLGAIMTGISAPLLIEQLAQSQLVKLEGSSGEANTLGGPPDAEENVNGSQAGRGRHEKPEEKPLRSNDAS